MWDFFETVRHRHSIRAFRDDMPVDEAQLHAILEAACAAPSAGDLQSYHISVVQDAGKRQALAKAADQAFIAQAPVCLVFSSDPSRAASKYGERGRQLYSLQDATIAASYAQLAVVAAQLDSTWVGFFDEAKVVAALELEPGLQPIAILGIGHAAETPQETPRRPLNEVVTFC